MDALVLCAILAKKFRVVAVEIDIVAHTQRSHTGLHLFSGIVVKYSGSNNVVGLNPNPILSPSSDPPFEILPLNVMKKCVPSLEKEALGADTGVHWR